MKRPLFASILLLLAACSEGTEPNMNMIDDRSSKSPTGNSDGPAAPLNGLEKQPTGEDGLRVRTPEAGDGASSDGQTNDNRAYYFKRGARGPTLSYGVPDTDNISLTLRCPSGGMGKTMLVYFRRPSNIVSQQPDVLTLSSGGSSQKLNISTRETQLGTLIEVQSAPDAGPLSNFADGSELVVRWGDERISVPAGNQHPEISEFFGACIP
jgi:hypothetical protein